MLLSQNDARRIADRLLSRSTADHCVIKIEGADATNLRFARNSATTNGYRSTLRVMVESRFGLRSGSASVTGLDEKALEEAVLRSEDIARSAPENPELMAPLGPQVYEAGAGYDAPTAEVRANQLAIAARPAIDEARQRNIDLAGFSMAEHGFDALATGAGLFAFERRTGADRHA